MEKHFDSLWLEDCIASLYENSVENKTFYSIYGMNHKAEIVVKTPFALDETDPFLTDDPVRQGLY